jgi:hypothetical protein
MAEKNLKDASGNSEAEISDKNPPATSEQADPVEEVASAPLASVVKGYDSETGAFNS